MKIEKINENQIKCTLNRADLAHYKIQISELAYGSEKAKELFKDMMSQANLQFGFDTEDTQLVVEATPISKDCIVLVLRRMDDDEMFDEEGDLVMQCLHDVFSDEDDEIEAANEAEREKLKQMIKGMLGNIANDPSKGTDDEVIPLAKPAPAKRAAEAKHQVASFSSLTDIVSFAHCVSSPVNSEVLKSTDDGRYYLITARGSLSNEEYTKVCSALYEFGNKETAPPERVSYMHEHFKSIIAKNAIEMLGKI